MKTIAVVMRLEKFDTTNKWFINKSYVDAIATYGWALFPICSIHELVHAASMCDALLVPGGYDVHAFYLNERIDEHCTYYDSFMDHFDLACIDAFYQNDKPILGICRGMQMLNVYFKGSILQHIPSEVHAPDHTHTITTTPHSFLNQLYPPSFEVNSYHHQVLGRLGNNLTASAMSKENYIEAIQHENNRILGVQWHPEQLEYDHVFAYFFDVVCA